MCLSILLNVSLPYLSILLNVSVCLSLFVSIHPLYVSLPEAVYPISVHYYQSYISDNSQLWDFLFKITYPPQTGNNMVDDVVPGSRQCKVFSVSRKQFTVWGFYRCFAYCMLLQEASTSGGNASASKPTNPFVTNPHGHPSFNPIKLGAKGGVSICYWLAWLSAACCLAQTLENEYIGVLRNFSWSVMPGTLLISLGCICLICDQVRLQK